MAPKPEVRIATKAAIGRVVNSVRDLGLPISAVIVEGSSIRVETAGRASVEDAADRWLRENAGKS